MKQLSFIGAGNMATAIIKGIATGNLADQYEISAYDLAAEKVEALAKYRVKRQNDVAQMVAESDFIVLAVKPQNIEEVLENIKASINRNAIIISIAAGISVSYLKDKLGYEAKAVPVMPNTPLLIGYGASVLAQVDPVSDEEFHQACEIFASAGAVAVIDEKQMVDIIPVNGSSPAYIYRFAKAFVDYAKEKNIKEEVALQLFCMTLIGSAKMMLDSNKTIDELITMVSSKGGTTLKGSEVLIEGEFEQLVKNACEACAARGYELAK